MNDAPSNTTDNGSESKLRVSVKSIIVQQPNPARAKPPSSACEFDSADRRLGSASFAQARSPSTRLPWRVSLLPS